MIKLNITQKLKTTEYNIPNSWQDITVEKFSKLFHIKFDSESTRIERLVTNISILTDIDEDILYSMNKQNFELIAENFKFLDEPVESKIIDKILIEGEEYYIKKEFNEMTLGEITSIDVILNKYEGNLMGCIDMLLTIFLRKKIGDELEEYNTKFKNRKDIFKNIKITEVYGLFDFFLSGVN